MKLKSSKAEVGVIVARFQVHRLHEAHLDIIDSVKQAHPKVLIFLGLSPLFGTKNNPLDYETRKKMILESFPEVDVHYITDIPDDDLWSKHLDQQIQTLLSPTQKAVLYGGRDSFITHYTGKFPTIEFEQAQFVSGTELRKTISSKAKGTEDFRAGCIYTASNKYPQTIATVDIIIYDEHGRLLMVRKPNETMYRFVGGFSEPQSESFEQDAYREVNEEVGVEITSLTYLGSLKIDDWRYRPEVDKIKTLVFVAQYIFGIPRPEDDVCEARWFKPDDTIPIVSAHIPIYKMYLEFLDKLTHHTL